MNPSLLNGGGMGGFNNGYYMGTPNSVNQFGYGYSDNRQPRRSNGQFMSSYGQNGNGYYGNQYGQMNNGQYGNRGYDQYGGASANYMFDPNDPYDGNLTDPAFTAYRGQQNQFASKPVGPDGLVLNKDGTPDRRQAGLRFNDGSGFNY